jgi:predicted nuclease of restriction endonuclease-like (RecB) superfamily
MTPIEISKFKDLIAQIQSINNELKQQATKSVNIAVTLRNWLIGYYISEYELKGMDRAEYGDKLYDRLADELSKLRIPRSDKRELYRYFKFYKVYPQIVDSLSPQLQTFMNRAVSDTVSLVQTSIEKPEVQIVDSLSPLSGIAPSQLIIKLSFTHIRLLLDIDDTTKRSFYEAECIKGNWSVRELQRQINSLYYERSGLSTNKKKLSLQTHEEAEHYNPIATIKDPYVFEFLGLKPKEVMSESHLEDQLISKLQDFLLELGHGFCFEARQQRILIGDTQYYIDLVFYHRILKCHVLVELKLTEFNHENIGQLNTYVSWYKQNAMLPGDNPPIGILLCSSKDSILVEYALAGMDNQLFVSKYQLELPKQEEMQAFIKEIITEFQMQD